MKVRINKTTYKIKFVNKIRYGGNNCNGIIYWEGRDNKGYPISKGTIIEIVKRKEKDQTIFHEITHALFYELSKKKSHIKRLADKCNDNESFINELSILMMDCFNIKKYEKE